MPVRPMQSIRAFELFCCSSIAVVVQEDELEACFVTQIVFEATNYAALDCIQSFNNASPSMRVNDPDLGAFARM